MSFDEITGKLELDTALLDYDAKPGSTVMHFFSVQRIKSAIGYLRGSYRKKLETATTTSEAFTYGGMIASLNDLETQLFGRMPAKVRT